MSEESWRIDFGEITEVIDRLSNVGNKLKHTSGKLKLHAISNKREFINKDYRKAVADELLVLCNKYKKRIENIENICARRVKIISECKSDTVKKIYSEKTTWYESIKVNVPSNICLQLYTSCQVSVNRIPGNKLRKYKLFSNTRQITNTLATSSDDDAISERQKRKKITLKAIHRDKIEKSTELNFENKSNTKDLDNKEQLSSVRKENYHETKQTICPANRTSIRKNGEHSDVRHDPKYKNHKSNDEAETNLHTKSEEAMSETVKHTDETVRNMEKMCKKSVEHSPRNNSDQVLSDVQNSDLKLTMSSDDDRDNVGHSEIPSLQADRCKIFKEAVTETKGVSDTHSSKLNLDLGNKGDPQSNEIPEDGTLNALENKGRRENVKSKKSVTFKDIDKESVSSKPISGEEDNQQKSLRNEVTETQKPKNCGNEATVPRDESTGTNEESDKKSESLISKFDDKNECFNEEKREGKSIALSDKDLGINKNCDGGKYMTSKQNSNEKNKPEKSSDGKISELSEQRKQKAEPKSGKKYVSGGDEDMGTILFSDDDKSMTSIPNSEEENNRSDTEIPQNSKPQKSKSQSKKAIVLSDGDAGTNRVSRNDISVSPTPNSDEINKPDTCVDRKIPANYKVQKPKPKSQKAIVSGDEDGGTNKFGQNDKSVSQTSNGDERNKPDICVDQKIHGSSMQQQPEPKSRKAIFASDEDTGTNKVGENNRSVSSSPNSNEINKPDTCFDQEIPANSKVQQPKPKSQKPFVSSDEDTGTNKFSQNDESVSSSPNIDKIDKPNTCVDQEIPRNTKQQKPKPRSKYPSEGYKSFKNEHNNDKSVSSISKPVEKNNPNACLYTKIPHISEQQKPELKSQKGTVSSDEETDTNNAINKNQSVSSTPQSNEENITSEYSKAEILCVSKKGKPKLRSKKSTISSGEDTSTNQVSQIDELVSSTREICDVNDLEKCSDTEISEHFKRRRPKPKSKKEKTEALHETLECVSSDKDFNSKSPTTSRQELKPEDKEPIGSSSEGDSSEKDKQISSSHRKNVSSRGENTMNKLIDCKNVTSRNSKIDHTTASHTQETHSCLEEILLSDTDSEGKSTIGEKGSNARKCYIKCVDISKLTSQDADEILESDREKVNTNIEMRNYISRKKETDKKTTFQHECKSVKPIVKLREFSVKVCRMPTFNQNFLTKHHLKVIKNFRSKKVVVELKQAERNERAKNDLLGDSSSSASTSRNIEPTNTSKSPSSASKRKRQRRIMRAKERLMSVSSTDTEEDLVQNASNKIKRELRMSQSDKSPNKLSPNKRSPNKQFRNKHSPHKKRKLVYSSENFSSETDDMVQKAQKKVGDQIEDAKSAASKSEDGSISDMMGRSLRRNRGNAQSNEQEENNKSASTAIENLTDLKNLKKTRRGNADTSSSEDGHQTKKLKNKISPGPEENRSVLKSSSENEDEIEEQMKSNDEASTIDDDDDSDSSPDMPKVFRTNGKTNADFAKQELLRDSGDTSATDKGDDIDKKTNNEEQTSADEEKGKKKSNGRHSGKKTRLRSDRLLRGKLDPPSSSDERDSSTSRSQPQKPRVDSDNDGSDYEKAKTDSDSDDSSVMKRTAKRKPMHKKSSEKESDDSSKSSSDGQTKKKRRRIKVIADSDASDDSGSGSEGEGGKKSGRKNIRKVIRKDQLEEATKKAAREERERVARIQDRQKLYNNTAFDESGKPDEVVLDKVVLDFDPQTKEPLISVDPGLVKKLKPHQANGIKFMWDACFESVKQIKKGKGSGCILAHCMGLGKTLQVVTLTHTLLAHWELTKVRRVLVVCPLSTVLNWVNEFRMWLKLTENDIDLNIFELSKFKQNHERSNQMEAWMECGGICVLGYEMFRNLSADNPKKFRKKMLRIFQESLVDPGPDLVVCDEGHLLKNEKTSLSQSMNRIKTIRRIVLTGTPLQNNLKEYYCMVQFVKQNLLGKYNEYLNRFVNPITNGQYTDSTDHDIRIMKRRSHVLHKLLDGAVQRRDYGVLAPFLPPKHEYIIFITLTEVQIKLYTYYLENLSRRPHPDRKSTSFLFPDFQALQRIWTHPLVLKANSERYEIMQQKKRDKEDEDEDSEGSLVNFIDDETTTEEETTEESSDSSAASDDSRPKKAKAKKKNKKHNKKARSTRSNPVKPAEPSPEKEVVVEQKSENWTEWWLPLVTDDQLEDVRNSNKLLLLFQILKECEAIGDKLLVFSQSLYSLDLIEHFLSKIDEATQSGQSEENLAGHIGSWSQGLDYFRLDGQTSCENRSLWCKSFNKESNPRARLFLISTRAGGLGINLVAANRVVIFDMSWNPSHDVQSIFRVYRFGQKKPCYVYRFLAMGTMEEKIYERQVTKQAISKRVIDEQQIDRHYAENDLAELYQFTPRPEQPREVPLVPKDRLFAEMLKTHEDAIYKYHEHDSLLENKEEETLTEEERKAAWDDFENEKNRPPPPPVNYNQNYNGLNNMLNPVAFAALANMLRRDYPLLTDQQLIAMMPSILYQADPTLYGGYEFNMMNLMNSQYGSTAMQPNLMMNPGGMAGVAGVAGAAGAGGMRGAAVGGSAARGALGGAMGGALAYQPVWQQQQQLQLQRLVQQQQQQQQQQKAQAGMKFYAGGLGSRDPISMALQQQKQREMILGGGGGSAGAGSLPGAGMPNSSLPARGRPPKPKPTINNEVVNLDDSD